MEITKLDTEISLTEMTKAYTGKDPKEAESQTEAKLEKTIEDLDQGLDQDHNQAKQDM